jgi:hypothetical protein
MAVRQQRSYSRQYPARPDEAPRRPRPAVLERRRAVEDQPQRTGQVVERACRRDRRPLHGGCAHHRHCRRFAPRAARRPVRRRQWRPQPSGRLHRDARRRGAAGIVAPEAVEGIASVAVADPRAALPHIAAAFHDYPADELRLIGITGTLGKTSTMLLLGDILQADSKPVGVVGSLGIKLAEATQETGITTPDASVCRKPCAGSPTRAWATSPWR